MKKFFGSAVTLAAAAALTFGAAGGAQAAKILKLG